MRGRLVAALCVVLSVPLLAQDPLYFVPADRVAVRVMRDVPPIDLAPGVHVRTVVGSNGSVSIGDFDKDGAAVLHHHTREQADVGISGVFDMTIGTHVESLAPGAGVIVPANVEHSIANTRGGVMTVIEFHTIPRPDLVPPRPALTFPSSPVPVAVPDNRTLIRPLIPQPGAANGTATAIQAETCTLGWRSLSRGAAAVDIHPAPTRVELFVYVFSGDADLAAPGLAQRVSAGSVIVIPGGVSGVTLKVADSREAVLVEFRPERTR